MKIKGKMSKGAEVDVKRFYMPGIVIEDVCSLCTANIELDLADDYLSHPNVGETPVFLYCHNCDHNWEKTVILEVKLKVPEEIK